MYASRSSDADELRDRTRKQSFRPLCFDVFCLVDFRAFGYFGIESSALQL